MVVDVLGRTVVDGARARRAAAGAMAPRADHQAVLLTEVSGTALAQPGIVRDGAPADVVPPAGQMAHRDADVRLRLVQGPAIRFLVPQERLERRGEIRERVVTDAS